MAQIHEGLLRIAIDDMQLVEIETQAIRIEGNATDSHRTTDGGGDLSGEHVAENQRHAEEAEEAEEHHDHDDGGDDAARPFGVEKSGRAVELAPHPIDAGLNAVGHRCQSWGADADGPAIPTPRRR